MSVSIHTTIQMTIWKSSWHFVQRQFPQRGTHAVVGVATMDAPLHSVGYQVNSISSLAICNHMIRFVALYKDQGHFDDRDDYSRWLGTMSTPGVGTSAGTRSTTIGANHHHHHPTRPMTVTQIIAWITNPLFCILTPSDELMFCLFLHPPENPLHHLLHLLLQPCSNLNSNWSSTITKRNQKPSTSLTQNLPLSSQKKTEPSNPLQKPTQPPISKSIHHHGLPKTLPSPSSSLNINLWSELKK